MRLEDQPQTFQRHESQPHSVATTALAMPPLRTIGRSARLKAREKGGAVEHRPLGDHEISLFSYYLDRSPHKNDVNFVVTAFQASNEASFLLWLNISLIGIFTHICINCLHTDRGFSRAAHSSELGF